MATTGGSSFFPDQQRLLEVVSATRALAHEIGSDVSIHLPEQEIDTTLRRRRALMALGAVNTGKSTLINALCRAPLCPVSKLPETKRITVYQDGGPAPGELAHPLAQTCLRSDIPALREFTLIDTPGTNEFTADVHAGIREMASACDALLVVLASTNPWEPATWDAITQLHPSDHGKIVFILQQADLRPKEDIGVLLGHVADLARKRCGISPPVFPVAAPAPVTSQGHGGIPECTVIWQHITASIRATGSHRSLISDWKKRSSSALRLLEDHIDNTQRDIGHKNTLLDIVEHDIGLMHASFRRQLATRIEELASSFRMGNDDTLCLLRKSMRFLPSLLRLFSGDRTASTMETAFVARLKSTFQDLGKEDAMAILSACRDHARTVEERLGQQGLSLPLSRKELEDHLTRAEDRFREKLDQAASVRLEAVRVRSRLSKELRRRNHALSAFTASCLIFLTLGSVAGALQSPWMAYVLCSIALLFLVGGVLTAWRTAPRVLEVFDRQMGDACVTFANALLTDYEDALRGVFRDYSETMLPLRSSLSRDESTVKPLRKRWQEIFLRLRTLDEELA